MLLILFLSLFTTSISSPFFDNIKRDNEEAMSIFTSILQSREGWKFVAEKHGVTVERRNLPPGSFVSDDDKKKSQKHACVRSKGIINAPSETVFNLFVDNNRVSEYNEHCILLKDITEFPKDSSNKWTKISWV